MAYDVFSVNGEILYNAFNGAAMIFNGNMIYNLIRAGFVVGTLHVGIAYLLNLEIRLNQMLVSLFFFMILFQPKTTVNIEDIYTAEVRTVANVPIGVAVPMSVVSSMGLSIANLFETAYALPNSAALTSAGYLNPLALLVKLRSLDLGSASSDKDLAGDLKGALKQYIEQCVMADLDLADSWMAGDIEVTPERLKKSPDIWAAMKTTFVNIDMRINLPSATNRTQVNCKTAYEVIDKHLKSDEFVASLDNQAKIVLGITDDQSAEDHITQAFSALGEVVGVDAQTFIRNAVMVSALQDGASAFISRPGIENLNMQWASEQSMFNQIVRPLMSFIEMFVVAISPIMAFFITLGGFGVLMMGRYLQLIAWVTLWPPLLAVCNLYSMTVVNKILAVAKVFANANGTGLESMYMRDHFFHELEVQLATGSMLAASVPAISLMIVYGGSAAATNLAGRMTSAATSSSQPETLTPKALNPGPVQNMGSMVMSSPNAPSKADGMADHTYNVSRHLERGINSARSDMTQAQKALSHAVGEVNNSSHGSSQTNAFSQTIMDEIGKLNHSGTTYTDKDGKSASVKEAVSSGEMENVAANLRAAITAGAGLPDFSPIKLKAAASAGLDSSAADFAEKKKMLDTAIQNGFERAQSEGIDITGKNSTSTGSRSDSSTTDSRTDAASSDFRKALQRYEQASNTFTELASLNSSAVRGLQLPFHDLARRLLKSGAEAPLAWALRYNSEGMSVQERADLQYKARDDIDGSSAKYLVGGERQVLSVLLQLDSLNPGEAGKIVAKYLMPTLSESGTDLQPDTFAGNRKQVDDIVSKSDMDNWENSAEAAGSKAENTPVDTWFNPPASNQDPAATGNTSQPALKPVPLMPPGTFSPQDSGENSGKQPWYDAVIDGKPALALDLAEFRGKDGLYEFSGERFRGRSTDNYGQIIEHPATPGRNYPPSGKYHKEGDAMFYDGPLDKDTDTAQTIQSESTRAGHSETQPPPSTASSGLSGDSGHGIDTIGVPEPGSVQHKYERAMKDAGGPVDPKSVQDSVNTGGHIDKDDLSGLELMYEAGTNHPVINGINDLGDLIPGVSDLKHDVEGAERSLTPIIRDGAKSSFSNTFDNFDEKIPIVKDIKHGLSDLYESSDNHIKQFQDSDLMDTVREGMEIPAVKDTVRAIGDFEENTPVLKDIKHGFEDFYESADKHKPATPDHKKEDPDAK